MALNPLHIIVFKIAKRFINIQKLENGVTELIFKLLSLKAKIKSVLTAYTYGMDGHKMFTNDWISL